MKGLFCMMSVILLSGSSHSTAPMPVAVTCDPIQLTEEAPRPMVQVALLLDTSSSMDGLIDQARTRLWRVVNELARAEKGGTVAHMEVALYEYGNSGLHAETGYIRQVVGLTTDLDAISEELFALKTNGGDEYCGQVIGKALRDLRWSDSTDNYKAVFIAGNESFAQGSVDFRSVCRDAIAGGVTVNTIFCGNDEEGRRTHWKEGADLADGRYMSMDQNQVVADIDTPQDDRILALNHRLNETYIAFGAKQDAKRRQVLQDANTAGRSKEAAVERSVAKSSANYAAYDWDVVSAYENDAEVLEEVEEDALPEPMKAMSPEERESFVKENLSLRNEIKTEMEILRKAREAFLAEKRAELGGSLDEAMLEAVLTQLKVRGFDSKNQ